MIERAEERFDLKPQYLAGGTAYGSAETLNWVVNEKRIAPHIPVVDKSGREDGSLSRDDFTFDKARNVYICPQGKLLHTTGYVHDGTTLLYRARVSDCGPCPLKLRCCPKAPERKIPRSIYEDARDVARALVGTAACRLRLRGPRGAQEEFTLGAIAQNLRRLAKLVARPTPAAEPCPA
jgi:hypothetical protein